eukprot:TRINITY_DN11444_c0_g3_i1.p2 TRINITY_DN11444_c0_g3~~TRINITY_DN11444_c0_g3_i1.p2  ORF type:complete len:502 (+),score=97.12 TRINITY_DN11444_c0_g3_i1:334-1839(+)
MLLVRGPRHGTDKSTCSFVQIAQEEEQKAAAVKIQAAWRGRKDRVSVAERCSRRKPWGFYTHALGLTYTSAAQVKELPSVSRQLYELLEDPSGSTKAKVLSYGMVSTILVSIVGFILETMPEVYWRYPQLFSRLEVICTTIFTIEYFARLCVCREAGLSYLQFIVQPMNVFDLMAIVPFYVEEIMRLTGIEANGALRALRVVRLVRIVRMLKLGRYASGMRLVGKALLESSQAISVLVFLLGVGVTVFSSAVFTVEMMSCPVLLEMTADEVAVYTRECADDFNRGLSPTHGLCCSKDSTPLDFPSIVAASWWSTVTMTSVGYGEVYPRTPLGKSVGVFAMLVGMLLIALPVAIVGQKFQDVYEASDLDETNLRANARMHVPEEVCCLVPHSDILARLRHLKFRDSNIAESIAGLCDNLDQVWQLREGAGRERQLAHKAQVKIQERMDCLLHVLSTGEDVNLDAGAAFDENGEGSQAVARGGAEAAANADLIVSYDACRSPD